MNSTTNPVIAAVADASGEMLALEPQSQHTSGMTVASIRRLIADDSHACTFQSFGQYRTALLKAIDRAMPQSPSSSSSSEANLFRKKPVVISAVQYTEAIRDAHLFDGADLPAGVFIPRRTINPTDRKVWSADAYINTLEGQQMSVSLGDWVITGVQGEHYPCKPEIFAATYEPASTVATPPSLPIDFKQASELLAMFGGEAGEVTLCVTDGHSGKGLYAHYTEYPEEGAEFLGATDGWAVPTDPSPHPEEGALLLGGDEGGKKGGEQ